MTKINIPKAQEKEVVFLPAGVLGTIGKKFEKIDQILFVIVLTLILSVIAIIVSVIGLFLDQMRYNNVAYKDYSEKLDATSEQKEINQLLLETNMKNQDLIINQQEQLIDLLRHANEE